MPSVEPIWVDRGGERHEGARIESPVGLDFGMGRPHVRMGRFERSVAVAPSSMRPTSRPVSRLLCGLFTILVLLTLLTPTHLTAHTRLRSSEPAADAELEAAPREIRLRFSEPVSLPLTRVILLGPEDTPIALGGPVRHGESAEEVVVPIEGALGPGLYLVVWHTAGRDGHPVRGSYEFAVAVGAAGALVPGAEEAGQGGAIPSSGDAVRATSPASPHPPSASTSTQSEVTRPGGLARASASADAPGAASRDLLSFSVASPLYSLVRFLLFVATLGVIGSIAFHRFVISRMVRRGRLVGYTLAEEIGSRPAVAGEWFSILLGMGLILRLVAQGYALGGGVFEGEALRMQLIGTAWGWGWVAQMLAAITVWAGFRRVRRGGEGGWVAAGVGGVLLAFTTGLSGHAAGLSSGASLALVADGGHILGAGGWLGSLLVLAAVGLPAARRVDERWGGEAVVELVNAFSGLALICAALVVATGGIGAILHVGSPANLLATGYGRALLLKLGVLGLVLGAGAYNYLRVRPAVGGEGGMRRLRASSTLELAAAAVVLMVTAVLVALPTP